jgi:holliday junction DNA helicase RuvA
MIGRIAGRIDHRGAEHVLIDVRGVGYIVHVSDRTLAALPGVGEACALYTELLVREDLLQLFGFTSPVEKEWHRLLTSVQGVGAKVSLAILGTLGPEGVGRAIALGDPAAVRAAPGVGPKLAQRVVLELRERAASVMALGAGWSLPGSEAGPEPAPDPLIETPDPPPPPRRTAQPAPLPDSARASADALSALANLGYAPAEAAAAVAEASAAEPEAQTPALIRAALRLLAPKG